MPLPLALLAAAPGLIKGVGSLFGSRKRKRAEETALENQKKAEDAVRGFKWSEDPTNPFANVENPFENATNTAADLTNPYADLKVNTQQAEFQAEQNNINQANILDALVQGGGNPAAAATQLAAQATNANAQISADIGRQEAANQQLAASGEQSRQQAFSEGEARRQQLVGQGYQWQQGLIGQGEQYRQGIVNQRDQARQDQNLFFLGRADKTLAQKQAARQAAKNDLISGFGSAIGAFAGAGGFGGGAGGAAASAGGGALPTQTATGLGTSTMTNHSNSFLNNTSGYDLSVPNLTGN